MATDLRAALLLTDRRAIRCGRSRCAVCSVLPFRMLRPESDTEFLAFSLPDAISNSLSESRLDRGPSSMAPARLKLDELDWRKSAKADVDMVLTGTCCAPAISFECQSAVDARDGSVIWSQTPQVSMGDILPAAGRPHTAHRRVAPGSLSAHDESALRPRRASHP
jgi:hypothetical protein